MRFELLLGGAIVLALVMTRANRIVTTEKLNYATALFFAATGLSFIGALMSHTVTDAVPVFVKLTKFFCIYLMILGTVDTETRLKKFAWTYVFAMLIVVGEPFCNLLGGPSLNRRSHSVSDCRPIDSALEFLDKRWHLHFLLGLLAERCGSGALLSVACIRLVMTSKCRFTAPPGIVPFTLARPVDLPIVT